jgi:hypothetical protein
MARMTILRPWALVHAKTIRKSVNVIIVIGFDGKFEAWGRQCPWMMTSHFLLDFIMTNAMEEHKI